MFCVFFFFFFFFFFSFKSENNARQTLDLFIVIVGSGKNLNRFHEFLYFDPHNLIYMYDKVKKP